MTRYTVEFTDGARDNLIKLGINREGFRQQIIRELPDPYGGTSLPYAKGSSRDDRTAIVGLYAIKYQVTSGLVNIMTVTRVA